MKQKVVMPGFVPGTHVLGAAGETRMAGSSPAVTMRRFSPPTSAANPSHTRARLDASGALTQA